MDIATLIQLFRVKQWYKNAIIFIALVFSLNLFNVDLLVKFILGFFSLCFISSSYYIINDLVDRKEDLFHPEKKYRPIAAGIVKQGTAVGIATGLFVLALALAVSVSFLFTGVVLALFVSAQLYIFWLKHEVFLDSMAIAINFVLRAAAGIFIVTTTDVSVWNLMGAFFLAIMLALGKRKAELHYLKESSGDHKRVLLQYKDVPVDSLILISITFLLVSYMMYSILERNEWLVLTIPIAFYALARYVNLTYTRFDIVGNPEKLFTDKRMLISISLWVAVVIIVLYGHF